MDGWSFRVLVLRPAPRCDGATVRRCSSADSFVTETTVHCKAVSAAALAHTVTQ